jgi:hypothetical protein
MRGSRRIAFRPATADSIAIAAQARSLLLVVDDPLEPEHQVLAIIKTNLDAKPPSLRFHIERDPAGAVK